LCKFLEKGEKKFSKLKSEVVKLGQNKESGLQRILTFKADSSAFKPMGVKYQQGQATFSW